MMNCRTQINVGQECSFCGLAILQTLAWGSMRNFSQYQFLTTCLCVYKRDYGYLLSKLSLGYETSCSLSWHFSFEEMCFGLQGMISCRRIYGWVIMEIGLELVSGYYTVHMYLLGI